MDEMRRCKRYPVLFPELEHANEEEDTSVLSMLLDPALLPEELMEQHVEGEDLLLPRVREVACRAFDTGSASRYGCVLRNRRTIQKA
jgi:hypothetical protein